MLPAIVVVEYVYLPDCTISFFLVVPARTYLPSCLATCLSHFLSLHTVRAFIIAWYVFLTMPCTCLACRLGGDPLSPRQTDRQKDRQTAIPSFLRPSIRVHMGGKGTD